MTITPLASRSPLADLPPVSTPGHGVVALERTGFSAVSVLARKGRTEELAQRVRTEFGIELPRGPRRAGTGSVAFVGLGVGAWLGMADPDEGRFVAAAERALGASASISDQSSSLVLLRLGGPSVRRALAKLLPIDLHPRAFQVGDAASTVGSHIATRLWRLDDGPGASAVFELAIARSYAGSFWEAFTESAAEFGFSSALTEDHDGLL